MKKSFFSLLILCFSQYSSAIGVENDSSLVKIESINQANSYEKEQAKVNEVNRSDSSQIDHSYVLSGLEILVGVLGVVMAMMTIYFVIVAERKNKELQLLVESAKNYKQETIEKLDNRIHQLKIYNDRSRQFANRIHSKHLYEMLDILYVKDIITTPEYSMLENSLSESKLFHSLKESRLQAVHSLYADGNILHLDSLYMAEKIEDNEKVLEAIQDAKSAIIKRSNQPAFS